METYMQPRYLDQVMKQKEITCDLCRNLAEYVYLKEGTEIVERIVCAPCKSRVSEDYKHCAERYLDQETDAQFWAREGHMKANMHGGDPRDY